MVFPAHYQNLEIQVRVAPPLAFTLGTVRVYVCFGFCSLQLRSYPTVVAKIVRGLLRSYGLPYRNVGMFSLCRCSVEV